MNTKTSQESDITRHLESTKAELCSMKTPLESTIELQIEPVSEREVIKERFSLMKWIKGLFHKPRCLIKEDPNDYHELVCVNYTTIESNDNA